MMATAILKGQVLSKQVAGPIPTDSVTHKV